MKHFVLNLILIAAATLSTMPGAKGQNVIPSTCTARINEIADFKQTNPKAGFQDGGKDFCAPTSLSDYLIWLGSHGYPSLLPKEGQADDLQIALIKTLASANYFGTDPSTGTSPAQIMRGLKKYINDCGYEIKTMQYQGFRPSPKEFYSGVTVPSLDWLRSGALSPKCTWLNLGWYRYDEDSHTYTRFSGHWVALVGYGVDASAKPSKDTIIVHDPMPRFGTGKVNVYIKLEKLSSGKLLGDYKGLPRDASRYYWFENYTDGHSVKELDNRYGIIDGGIVLELVKPLTANRP
jgi:hypothetical protein